LEKGSLADQGLFSKAQARLSAAPAEAGAEKKSASPKKQKYF